MRTIILFIFLIAGISSQRCMAQDELLGGKDYTLNTFRGTILINSPTTEMVAPHSFTFTIRHRFGEIGMDKTVLKQFLGTDNIANIRFAFELPLGKFVNIGLGRTKFGKTYDAELKALLYRQVNGGFPLSIAMYMDMSCMTDAFPKVQPNSYFENTNRPFHYNEYHRLSYIFQLILSRKFTDNLSAMIVPQAGYRNLAPLGQENATGVITGALSFRTGLKASFICEGSYLINNKPENNLWPLSAGWEWGTAGHVFQIIVSSTNEMVLAQAYTTAPSDYTKGKIFLGFNLKRTFWSKKYK